MEYTADAMPENEYHGRKVTAHGAVISVLAFAIVLLTSCASTSMVSSKKNPAYSGPKLGRLMVLGVSPDPKVRRAFEDEFAEKLKESGVAARPSYPAVPQINSGDPAQLRKAIEASGVDGVLAARLVTVTREPTALQAFNFEDRSAGFYQYYGSESAGSLAPMYGNNTITVHFDLYSVKNSQLVWAGDAETFPSTDVREVTDGLAYTVIRKLKALKLI